MPGLSRLRRVVSERGERGAVAVMVALMLGGVAIAGAGALAVDTGTLYVEREELQTGADAAAVAVAKACTSKPTTCNPSQLAASYADRNAKDGHSAVIALCGRGWNLPECPAEPTNLTACLGAPPATGNYVEVRTATELADGKTLLPPTFAKGLVGRQNFEGTRVKACARAAATPAGPPLTMVSPAVTVEVCYHDTYTLGGTVYLPVEKVLRLKTGGPLDVCNTDNGSNGPGNFGWLDHDGDCEAQYTAGSTMVGGNPGINTDAACKDLLDWYIDHRQPMALPLFDLAEDNGQNLRYRVVGFAAFMVTGYEFSGQDRPSRISGLSLCGGSERCLYGYFVEATMPIVTPGGADYGITGEGRAKVVG